MDVWKPKKLEGLGVRDLRFVNLVILGKWMWCLFSEASDIWCDILIARYGVAPTISILDGEMVAFDRPRLGGERVPFGRYNY